MKVIQPVTSLCIITFQKIFIDLKSTQSIRLEYLGMYVKHRLTHASVVLVIFYFMLQNKQSNGYSLQSMASVVVLFAYPIKLIIIY